MRLKTKFVFSEPNPGTTRLRRVFAWVPIVISGERIWLEYYEVLEGSIQTAYPVIIDGEKKTFTVSNWVKLSKRLLN